MSTTQIVYSEKDNALQIVSRIFIDDLEKTLEERYNINLELAMKNDTENSDPFIKKYIAHRLKIKINDIAVPFHYIGHAYQDDMIKCYMEIEDIDINTVKNIEVENKLLFDTFEEQQNIVHFKIKKDRKSMMLVKENNKGVLNL